ncbi:UNVERIFIED_CONTAM: hypothetical protein FKN15_028725 [Acipenser sinensis]
MPPTRDPYPNPKYENDDVYLGRERSRSKKVPHPKPTHMAQQEDPWNRLNARATLASARREIFHFDHEAPRDSLDFHLKTTYNQHEEFLRDKNETLYQKETISDDHGRILKNRVKEPPGPPELQRTPIRVWTNPQKESIHSIHGAVESHHNASTNRGYSRKHDGGFYSV